MPIIAPAAEFNSDEPEDLNFKCLSAEEVQVIRDQQRQVSPWRIVGLQMWVGFVVAIAAWTITGVPVIGWSAGYGALAVVIPAAVFVRGLARQQRANNSGAALVGFFVWEIVKIALTVAILFAAPRLILQLNWLALLAGFVVTMKVYWLAMWLYPVRKNQSKKN